MNFFELLKEGIDVLKVNKLRTSLSALGIIIGISSVIALMTLGQASQQSIKQQIQSLGSNLLVIRPGSSQEGFLRTSNSASTLTITDANNILNNPRITTISKVAAETSNREQVSYGQNNTNVSITAVSQDYLEIRNINVAYGSTFSSSEVQNLAKVAIIGPTIVQDLFTNVNPIGQKIKIGSTTFTVIGITASKATTGPSNYDEAIYIPITTAQKLIYGTDAVSAIYATAKSDTQMEPAQNQLGFYLLEQHKIKDVADADFTISSQEDLIQTISSVTQTFTMLLTGISAISLVVGGIGIMNIMLVTVTERTREIGLRKALGAKRKIIIMQFLLESFILTLFGGLLGVILGLAISYILTKSMSLPFVFSTMPVVLAFAVSTLIGVIFGWYPAYKASKLQPIEALRYE